MKKIKLNAAKLQLNKEKVTELSNPELIKGGAADTTPVADPNDPMVLSLFWCAYTHKGPYCCPKTVNPI